MKTYRKISPKPRKLSNKKNKKNKKENTKFYIFANKVRSNLLCFIDDEMTKRANNKILLNSHLPDKKVLDETESLTINFEETFSYEGQLTNKNTKLKKKKKTKISMSKQKICPFFHYENIREKRKKDSEFYVTGGFECMSSISICDSINQYSNRTMSYCTDMCNNNINSFNIFNSNGIGFINNTINNSNYKFDNYNDTFNNPINTKNKINDSFSNNINNNIINTINTTNTSSTKKLHKKSVKKRSNIGDNEIIKLKKATRDSCLIEKKRKKRKNKDDIILNNTTKINHKSVVSTDQTNCIKLDLNEKKKNNKIKSHRTNDSIHYYNNINTKINKTNNEENKIIKSKITKKHKKLSKDFKNENQMNTICYIEEHSVDEEDNKCEVSLNIKSHKRSNQISSNELIKNKKKHKTNKLKEYTKEIDKLNKINSKYKNKNSNNNIEEEDDKNDSNEEDDKIDSMIDKFNNIKEKKEKNLSSKGFWSQGSDYFSSIGNEESSSILKLFQKSINDSFDSAKKYLGNLCKHFKSPKRLKDKSDFGIISPIKKEKK